MEGTSAARNSGGSTSSRSDSSCDYESTVRSHSSHRNRRCFMSKAIHPLSFPSQTPTRGGNNASTREFNSMTPQRQTYRSSSASVNSLDFSEPPEASDHDFRCSLCDRFLSQRSPWGSRRIIKSGDMPVSGVLACRHVFHAECLDQTTPKARKNDPPCPVCFRMEEESFSKLRNNFPRLKPFCEDAPNKAWGCVQAGDCVDGALAHAPNRNALVSFKFRKNISLKGNREFSGKLRKSGSFIGSVEGGGVGSSRTTGVSGFK